MAAPQTKPLRSCQSQPAVFHSGQRSKSVHHIEKPEFRGGEKKTGRSCFMNYKPSACPAILCVSVLHLGPGLRDGWGICVANTFILKSYRQELYRKTLAFWMLEKGKFGDYFSLKKKNEGFCESVSSVCPSIGVNLRAQACSRYFLSCAALSGWTHAGPVCWLEEGLCLCAVLEKATRWESGTNAGKSEAQGTRFM